MLTTSEVGVFAVALVLISAVFLLLHGDHYRNRKIQLLTFRVEALEKIVTGQHDA